MEKQETERESKIREHLRESFGRRFETASLGKIDLGCFNGVVDWLKKPKGFMVIHGTPGSGKTYFAAAVFSYLFDRFESKRIHKEGYIFRKLYEGFGTNANSNSIEYLIRLVDDQFLIVDDLGSVGKSENGWKESMLFEMIDYRYSSKKPTLFTTNLDYNEFVEMYNPRIASRLFAKENMIVNSGNVDLRKEGK